MQDYQLYQQILGIEEPWRVKRVTLNRPAGAVEVEVECLESVWACPLCQQRLHVHDWDRRCWRHLDSCQFQTILVAEVPRVECAAHGTQTVAVPWAEKYSRFTRFFERLAIDVMRECSVAAACEILGISWIRSPRQNGPASIDAECHLVIWKKGRFREEELNRAPMRGWGACWRALALVEGRGALGRRSGGRRLKFASEPAASRSGWAGGSRGPLSAKPRRDDHQSTIQTAHE